MGFNKRYIGKDNVLGVYDISGIEGLKRYFFQPDALLFTDTFAANMYDLLYDKKEKIAEKELRKELIINN
tara:strand:+ start:92 stop:301 length:210 start_codon:yes stop_codon:yes gene_type:complete